MLQKTPLEILTELAAVRFSFITVFCISHSIFAAEKDYENKFVGHFLASVWITYWSTLNKFRPSTLSPTLIFFRLQTTLAKPNAIGNGWRERIWDLGPAHWWQMCDGYSPKIQWLLRCPVRSGPAFASWKAYLWIPLPTSIKEGPRKCGLNTGYHYQCLVGKTHPAGHPSCG